MIKQIKKAREYLTSTKTQQLSQVARFKDKKCAQELNQTQIVIPITLALQTFALIPESNLTKKENGWIKATLLYINTLGEKNSSFNYFIEDKGVLPDDLDDTAYCLSALTLHSEEIHENYILKILKLESRVGGPYRTWYIDPDSTKEPKWLDIDPVVNANLLYFMSIFGIDIPKTESYALKLLKGNDYSSPYYPSDITFLYFLSKYAKQISNQEIKELIKVELKKYKYSSLSLIEKIIYLTITTVLGGTPTEKRIKDLSTLQETNGAMPDSPFCYDMGQKSKSYVSSKVITTSLFLELLLLNTKFNEAEEKENKQILSQIAKQSSTIEKELHSTPFYKEVRGVFPVESNYKALSVPNALAYELKAGLSKAQEVVISDLAVAVYFSWIGYTLLDDILDGHRESRYIPVANTLIRLGLKYFAKVSATFPNFEVSIQRALQECDQCYFWESNNAKFKETDNKVLKLSEWDYSYVEQRMQPYLVSLRFIARALGYSKAKTDAVYKFFRSQVIIDQLNDDAHDWHEDYEGGTLTFVLARILSESEETHKHEQIFWDTTLPEVISISEGEYEKAIEALKVLNLKKGFLRELIDKTISPLRKAKSEMEKTARIINKI